MGSVCVRQAVGFHAFKPHAFSLAHSYCCRAAAEDAEFQARLELIKAEAAQKKAAGVSHTRRRRRQQHQHQKKPAAMDRHSCSAGLFNSVA